MWISAPVWLVQMPKPLGVEEVLVKDTMRPVVHMEGIDHVIMEGVDADEELAEDALRAMGKWQPNACGILFLKGDEMTPVVYVRSTESLIWESSCGSGSVACAWYLAASTGMLNQDGIYKLKFTEPGGVVEAGVMVKKSRDHSVYDGRRYQTGGRRGSLRKSVRKRTNSKRTRFSSACGGKRGGSFFMI